MKKNSKMFKRFILMVSFSFLLVGCSSKPQTSIKPDTSTKEIVFKNAYSTIKNDDILHLTSEGDFLYSFEDADVLFEASEYVALIRVDSIDGAINKNEFDGSVMYPSTYGQLTVLHLIKGDLQVKKSYRYLRAGATIAWDQYLEGLNAEQVKKQRSNIKDDNIPKFVEVKFLNDIDLEPGKVYLVYLEPSKHIKEGLTIEGLQGGLREVQNGEALYSKDTLSITTNSLKVFNNFTKTWESLETIISN